MALLDKLKIGGTVYDAWATKDQVGSANDASSATTVFGKIKAVIDYLVGIVTTAPYAKDATVAKEAAATANKETVMGGKLPVNTAHSIPAVLWNDDIKDIDNEGELFMHSSVLAPEGFGVGSVVTAENMTDGEEDMYYVAKAVNNPSIGYDGQDYSISGATFMTVEKGKCYRCTSIVPLSYTEDDETITGELYVYEEYEPGRSIKEVYDKLDNISPEDPYSQALAAFFNITPPVPNAVPMTQQEVEDDLDELWNLIITQ